MSDHAKQMRDLGRAVLEIEARSIQELFERIDDDFVRACDIVLACKGRMVVTGMGKSGHIGRKLAATFASTGTPAFFVHPGEAGHGDLGMITENDVVLALSNSGETAEISMIIPVIKRQGVPLLSITGRPESTLARESDVHLNAAVSEEACPLGLAPTSSTTAALAMGDALAVALLDARGFTADDFARSHPAGSLGRRLLLHVGDVMRKDEGSLPTVKPDTCIKDALVEISRGGLGITVVVNDENQVQGVFTDGDLRRTLDHQLDIHNTPVSETMTANCKTTSSKFLAVQALKTMEDFEISALPVVAENNQLEGIITMHLLLQAGVV